MENKMSVKNISNHDVGIVVPEMRFSRFIAPNRSIFVEKDKLEELLTYPGVSELFNNQYLVCEDSKSMEEIGGSFVSVPSTKEETLTEEEIVDLINSGTELELDKLLKSATSYRMDTIVSAALKCDGLTLSKVNMIQKASGKDILAMKKSLKDDK